MGGGYVGEDVNSVDFFLAKTDFDGDEKSFFLADAGDYYVAAGEGAYDYSLTLFTLSKEGEYPGCLDTPSVREKPLSVSAREIPVTLQALPWGLSEFNCELTPLK